MPGGLKKSFLKERPPVLCNICGLSIRKASQATKDHEPPLSRGGLPENWYWTHASCNWDKGSLTVSEYHMFCRLAHRARIQKLTPDESFVYQSLKKMRKMKKYERKQNFVKKEQARYRKEQARAEKEKSKIHVFTPEEQYQIKVIRAEIKAQRRLYYTETVQNVFTHDELIQIHGLLEEFNSIN